MYCHWPASSEYSAWATGDPVSSASKVKLMGLAHGPAFGHGAPPSSAAFRLVTRGGVVSTSNRSLSLNAVSASPGLCEGASDDTIFIWYPPSGRRLASKLYAFS